MRRACLTLLKVFDIMCVTSRSLSQMPKTLSVILSAITIKSSTVKKDLLKREHNLLFPTVQNNHLSPFLKELSHSKNANKGDRAFLTPGFSSMVLNLQTIDMD